MAITVFVNVKMDGTKTIADNNNGLFISEFQEFYLVSAPRKFILMWLSCSEPIYKAVALHEYVGSTGVGRVAVD